MDISFGAIHKALKPAGAKKAGRAGASAAKPVQNNHSPMAAFAKQMQALKPNLNQPALPHTARKGWIA